MTPNPTPPETTPTSETSEALPSFTVGGIEYEPAKFSPLGTVALKASDLAVLLAALPPELREAILGPYLGDLHKSVAEDSRANRARATTAERELADWKTRAASFMSARDVLAERVEVLVAELAGVKGERDSTAALLLELASSGFIGAALANGSDAEAYPAMLALANRVRLWRNAWKKAATPPAVETPGAIGHRYHAGVCVRCLAAEGTAEARTACVVPVPELVVAPDSAPPGWTPKKRSFGARMPERLAEVVEAKCPECSGTCEVPNGNDFMACGSCGGTGRSQPSPAGSFADMSERVGELPTSLLAGTGEPNVERNGTEAAEKAHQEEAGGGAGLAGRAPERECDRAGVGGAGPTEGPHSSHLHADSVNTTGGQCSACGTKWLSPEIRGACPMGRDRVSESAGRSSDDSLVEVARSARSLFRRAQGLAEHPEHEVKPEWLAAVRFAFAAGSSSVPGPAGVERVAAAIYETKYQRLRYADLQDEKRDDFRLYARAAIAAVAASSVDRERIREALRVASALYEERSHTVDATPLGIVVKLLSGVGDGLEVDRPWLLAGRERVRECLELADKNRSILSTFEGSNFVLEDMIHRQAILVSRLKGLCDAE